MSSEQAGRPAFAWRRCWVQPQQPWRRCLRLLVEQHQNHHHLQQRRACLSLYCWTDRSRLLREFFLGHGELCASGRDEGSLRNYCCLEGAVHGQSAPPSSMVVGRPEPIRSGKHSLRSRTFDFSEGYRVEVIEPIRASEGDMIEGFGVPAWYGSSVFLPASYSADELSSPDRVFQWHGDSRLPSGESYRCNLNPVLTFEVLGLYVALIQKMQRRGYHSPRPAEPSGSSVPGFAVPLFRGGGGGGALRSDPTHRRARARARTGAALLGGASTSSCTAGTATPAVSSLAL